MVTPWAVAEAELMIVNVTVIFELVLVDVGYDAVKLSDGFVMLSLPLGGFGVVPFSWFAK